MSGNNVMVFAYTDAQDGFEAQTSGMHLQNKEGSLCMEDCHIDAVGPDQQLYPIDNDPNAAEQNPES